MFKELFGFKSLKFQTAYGTVTEGDSLHEIIAAGGGASPENASARYLADHWAVRSVTGQIARGLNGTTLSTAIQDADGQVRVGDQRGSRMIHPHTKRIALDILRFGWHVSVIAEDDSGTPASLVPLPADEAIPEIVAGRLVKVTLGDKEWAPSKVFIVAEELPACSPLESLRDILDEDYLASQWRRSAWKTSPRGIVKRGLDAPEWSGKARQRFEQSFMGSARSLSPNAGQAGFALLEDGMEWENSPLPDASSAQWLEARKLTPEIVCDVYGVQGSILATGADRQVAVGRRHMLNGPVADLAKLITNAYSEQLAQRMYGDTNGGKISVFYDVDGAVQREDEDPNRTKSAVGVAWRTVDEQRAMEGRAPLGGAANELPQPTSAKSAGYAAAYALNYLDQFPAA